MWERLRVTGAVVTVVDMVSIQFYHGRSVRRTFDSSPAFERRSGRCAMTPSRRGQLRHSATVATHVHIDGPRSYEFRHPYGMRLLDWLGDPALNAPGYFRAALRLRSGEALRDAASVPHINVLLVIELASLWSVLGTKSVRRTLDSSSAFQRRVGWFLSHTVP